MKRHRAKILIVAVILGLSSAWVYWNRPKKADISQFAPADSLAFVEASDLAAVVAGIEQSQAWTTLSRPVGAPAELSPNRWWVRIARWTGIGSTDAVLFARAQVGVVFSGAQATQAGSTLTIKPLATFIVETHTSQWRMKAAVARHIENLARRVYQNPVFVRKRIENSELEEWTSADGSHQIVTAFLDTVVIVGNDETSVLRSIKARGGNGQSLRDVNEFNEARTQVDASSAPVFGFVSQAGIKSLLQAFALNRTSPSPDAVTVASIFADTFGGLVKHAGCSARFHDGIVEDRCSVRLVNGVADKLRANVTPDRGPELNLSFVPPTIHSVSLYRFHDVAGFWSDLNVAVSSQTDLIGSIAARPMLRSLLKPYGIEDPETFSRSIGTRLQTIRFEENAPSVLVAEAFDRPALRTLVLKRFGKNQKSEKLDSGELFFSSSDNLVAAFTENHFLIGPAEMVRRALSSQTQQLSISSSDSFRKSQSLVDVSLPIIALTFTNDQRATISFVEAFSRKERPAFATTAAEIDRATQALPLAVSAAVLKESYIEWRARSSFGIGGSLTTQLFPERSQ